MGIGLIVIIAAILSLIFWRQIYDIIRGKRIFDDLYLFNSKLAELVKLELPLDQAVEQILIEIFNPLSYRFSKLNKALRRVHGRILTGKSLGEALDMERKVFPAYYVDMVRIGEAEGDLHGALKILNSYLSVNKEYSLSKGRLSGYFVLMTLVFLVVVTFISQYITPTFIALFEGIGEEYLISSTRLTFNLMKIVPVIFAILFFVLIGVYFIRKSRAVKDHIDRQIIFIPSYKDLIRIYEYMIFCRVMSNLLDNRIPLDRALILAARAASNFEYSEAIKAAANSVEPTLARAMDKSKLFDRTFLFMLSLGEKTEKLAEVFNDMADYYTNDYVMKLKHSIRITEVSITLLFGLFIGFFTFGAFMPLVKLIEVINNSITY